MVNNELFKISKEQAKNILTICLSTGGEFAECFMDSTTTRVIEMTDKQISKSSVSSVYGASLRIIKGETEVNAAITICDYDSLVEAAKKLASAFTGVATTTVLPFVEKQVASIVKPIRVKSTNNQEEVKLLERISNACYSVSDKITQARVFLWQKHQNMFVFATDSTWQGDERCNTRLFLSSIASNGVTMESVHDSVSGNAGLEMYDSYDLESWAKDIAKDTVAMLDADYMVGGDIPVVLNNGFGGVILHEACVHGLEATSVAKGNSVFCNKLGKKIASDIVNAVDTGIDPNSWGSINVDDEGTPARRNVLIENGILKSYLVDKKNSKKMNHPITSSSRRESYKWVTTSRMTNTYFLNGSSTFDEIIKSTKYGLFAKKMGGGSVNPATGEFNFGVEVGYLIEDGKITKPVKGATLVGSGKDVLLNIDLIGNNLQCAAGMCGSMSGSIPTNVGQPTLRVSHITVGGKGDK